MEDSLGSPIALEGRERERASLVVHMKMQQAFEPHIWLRLRIGL